MPTSYYIYAFRNVCKRTSDVSRAQCEMENARLAELAPDCLDSLEGYNLRDVTDDDLAMYRENPAQDSYSFERFCERLLLILVEGKEFEPVRDVGAWCDAISEAVEQRGEWREEEGRGPFWEMFRYLYRGTPMDETVCRKLAADFDRWDGQARSTENRKFYDYYKMLHECFQFSANNGVVVFPYARAESKGAPCLEQLEELA